jgi:hypothetical protein
MKKILETCIKRSGSNPGRSPRLLSSYFDRAIAIDPNYAELYRNWMSLSAREYPHGKTESNYS